MAPGNLERLLDQDLRTRLAAAADVDFDEGRILTDFQSPDAVKALADAELLFTCWGCPRLDADALAKAPNLRALVHGAGTVKGIVTDACWERGLQVSSAVAANAVPVAEYTVAMIVLAGKRAYAAQAAYKNSASRRGWAAEFPTLGNYRTTVGLVGASRVGRRVIELLGSFDMNVLLHDPTISEAEAAELGVEAADLDELVRRSDVVSIHAPDIPATHDMFDARRLQLMKDGATLINTARGRLVDTDALTAELATGRISAVLDVTYPEPLPADSPLFAMPNVVLTPHIAGSLGNEVLRMGALAVSEVERYAQGLLFAYPVRPEQLAILA
jgi:phosphoglycerate dehydrogenase-like enzyme